MRRRVVRILAAVLVCVFGAAPVATAQVTVPPPASPTPKPGGPPAISAVTAILVSLGDSSRVLFNRSVHGQRAPASLTKIVTALVARDRYRLDEVVKATPLVLQVEGSRLNLEPGMSATVKDLLYALLLKSANDVGMALAAHDPFGYEHFIQLMNEKARSLGAFDSQFRNPHGLDMPGHVSTAWDMAIFARELLADPVLASIVATHGHSMPWKNGTKRIFDNHNKLLTRYPGVVGVKTGFTVQSGHCLVAADATADGILVSVVMGSLDHYKDTTALFDYGKARELGAAAGGGGGIDTGVRLDAPPPPVTDPVRAIAATPTGADPRDDMRWVILMSALALATAAMFSIRRRREPLREAADVYPYLEPLVPRSRDKR